jgi:Rgg/GadR/MutR family transcriptional activator
VNNTKKTNFGKIYKEIRENKGISLTAIADEEISKSTISKFENESSNISAEHLYHILKKVNVTPTEFFYITRNYKNDEFEEWLNNISVAASNNNIPLLKSIRDDEFQKFEVSKNKFYKINGIIADSYINYLLKKPTNKEYADFVSDFLFSIENWTKYETIIFGNVIWIFSNNVVQQFSREILSRNNLFIGIENNKRIVVSTLINACVHSVLNNDVPSFKNFLQSALQISLNESEMDLKIRLNFLNAIYLIVDGKREKGNELANEYINFYAKINENLLKNDFKELLEEINEKF